MTNTKHIELLEKLLVSFCQEEDPMKEMLQWMTTQLMEIEVNSIKTEAEKGEHSEAALMSVIQECWINGISTRKMQRVFKSFGIDDISAGQVSNVTKELDAEVSQFPDAMEILSDGLEDALQFFHFDDLPHGRTSSTNHLERLNLEIRRRSNVVGIFPSTDSFLRLIGSYLMEYQADWATGKAYIKPDRLQLFIANNLERKAA